MAWKTDEMYEDVLHEFIEAGSVGMAPGCKWLWKRPLSDEEPWRVPGTLDTSTGLLTLEWRRSGRV